MVRPRGQEVLNDCSGVACLTGPSPAVDIAEQNQNLSNAFLTGETVTKNAVSVEAEHGVNFDKKAVNFQGKTYHSCGDVAKDLCLAIAACPPNIAGQIMAAALDDLGDGGPIATFIDAKSDAEFWAKGAAPQDLTAYCAAICCEIGKRGWAMAAKKRLFIQLWGGFSDNDRQKFMAKVDPHGRFQGRPV